MRGEYLGGEVRLGRAYRVAVTASLLMCGDPLRPARCDPHFAAQAAAARACGAAVVLLDHDALLAGRVEEAVRRVPRDSGALWYRGWMIPAEAYADLAGALAERGARLLTAAAEYRLAHELPGWYRTFREVTPVSSWIPGAPLQAPDEVALVRAVAGLPGGAGIVKDYVKSRKHDWDEACFLPDLADSIAVRAVVSRFVELQDDSLAGGVVLRAFEELRGEIGEARVWWLDGRPLLTTAHPDTPGLHPLPDLGAVVPMVAELGCRFVTTDLAQRRDGVWRVIEVGDGQVSGLPVDVDPAVLIEPLLASEESGRGD
jgi:hypothetical protein